jgi:hypothetical protein
MQARFYISQLLELQVLFCLIDQIYQPSLIYNNEKYGYQTHVEFLMISTEPAMDAGLYTCFYKS